MDWSGIKAEEKVFHNMAVLRELVFYLGLEDILSLLESRVGKFEGVVVGKKAQENLLSYLVNYLAKEDWKNQIPNYGGEAFDRSQRKISVYVKILCFLDCNKEKVLTDLTVKLLQTFPVIRRSWVEDFSFEDQDTQLSRCTDDNRGSIRTTLGGNFTHMSPATFVISKLAENAWTEGGACSRGELLDKTLENVDTENLGDKSRYVGGGCLSETLIGGVLSHLEDSDISFKRLDVTGIHLDSPASIIKFGSLMEKLNKSENSEIGDIDGHIDHLRFSSILSKDDWEALLRILMANSHLQFDQLVVTGNNLKQAGGLIRELWNQTFRSILILPEDYSDIEGVRCFYKVPWKFLNEWNFGKLVEFLVLGKC